MPSGPGRPVVATVLAAFLALAATALAQAPRPPGTAAPGTEIDVTDIPDRFLTPEGRRLKEERKGGAKPGAAPGGGPGIPPAGADDIVDSLPDELLSPEGRRRKAERAAQRAGLDPGGVPAIDTSDSATRNAQSLLDAARQIIPATDADLGQIEGHAKAIQALADACQGMECPIVQDCATATALLQELVNADAWLNAALGALNRASADAAAAHNSVVAQGSITATNLSIATEALGVKQYFYRLSTMLFDLASVADDIKGMAEKGSFAPGDNWAQKLDTAYETIKDLEGLAGDVANAANDYADPSIDNPSKAPDTSVVSGPTGRALGVKPETMSGLNDLKSNLSDAANTIDEMRRQMNDPAVKEALKNGKMKPGDLLGGPAKAIAKIAFRDLKVLVEKQIRELESLIADLEKNLTAEQKVLAGLFAQRQRIVTRRDEASDALRAVRRARESLSACLARACGPASITRPVIPDYYAPPPGMSRFDLAPHWGWGNALRDLNPKLAASAVALARRFTVRNYCPAGGGTFTDPGGGGGATGPTGEGTGLPPRNAVTTPCQPCQPIADQIGRILDAIEALRQENAAIERDLSQLEYLRAKLQLERKRLASLQEQARGLRDAVRTGNVLGLNVAGSARQSLTLVEAQIVAVRGEVIYLENEIARIEAEGRQLARNKARIEELNAQRRALRAKLRYCEEDLCRAGYWVEADTVINVAGNNPFNPVDPLGPTTTSPPPADGRPVATVVIRSHTAEGGAPGAFTVTLSKPSPSNFFVVSYTLSGSATLGSDYAAVTAGAPVPMGQTSVDVTVTPIDDSLSEGDETVQLTLVPGEGYALGVPSTAIMTIADNDGAPPAQPGTIQLSASAYQGAEGQGSVQVTATRTGGTSGQVTVSYNTGPSSASPGQDYTPVNGVLAWGSGDATARTFTVPILDDTLVEGTESFFVSISNPTGGATLGSPSTASVTIADNDVATGPCGAQGSAWAGNPGTYNCSGSCSPTPSPQTLTVNGDVVTISPFHAGGAATFQGCGSTLNSQSNTLVYFGQANHRASITRGSNNGFNANIVSSGGGTCFFSCSR